MFCLTASAGWAQTTTITRTALQKIEAPDPSHTVESYLVTIAPHAVVPRHTHPGVEIGYLVSGGGTMSVAGEPERTIKTGDSWAIPAGKPHTFQNTGNQPETLVVTYVLEKGQPLSTPAP
jgi:quercetin dioxygenase-like cupin family protein